MKIAVNTRLLLKDKLEGIGWFTYESLKRITQQHPEHEFLFLFDRKYDESFLFSDNITPIVVHPQARHPILFYLWFEWMLPPVLRKHKVDLFLSPDGYLSQQSEVKQLAVIHDINFEHYPQHLPLGARLYLREFFPRFAAKATRIATVSEFSKSDLVGQYKVDPKKIDVVYNGASELFQPLDEIGKEQIRNQYTSGSPYFIYIGSIQPRKNMHMLFEAFDRFKKEISSDVKLLIVGEKKWWTSIIENAFDTMEYQADVVFTGRLSTRELSKALASSMSLVYVSFFEGFGIPILEAMNCEVPVITSSVTSMPEVAGKAAVLVSPFDVDSIKGGMLQVYKDEALRKRLIEEGKMQRNKFSWDQTASLLWSSVEKTIETR